MFIDVFQVNEEKSIRILKEKFAEQQKRICQAMGWRDYNLSGFDGVLGPVEVQCVRLSKSEKIEEKDNVKARQKRFGEIGVVSLNERTEGRFHEP